MKIISEEGEEIPANMAILSMISPILLPLLSSSTLPTLILPDCSSSSIKHLLNIITNGFTLSDSVSYKNTNDIVETSQLLEINIANLSYDITKEINKNRKDQTEMIKENCKSVEALPDLNYEMEDNSDLYNFNMNEDLPNVKKKVV